MVAYICKRCNKEYKNKKDYTRHINRINVCEPSKRYDCEYCNKNFVSKYSLDRHHLVCKKIIKPVIIEPVIIEPKKIKPKNIILNCPQKYNIIIEHNNNRDQQICIVDEQTKGLIMSILLKKSD